ncbi:MAG: RIP metalloprotease RseP [bacterium]
MTLLLFLLTIIVLVGIHELGHFLAARAVGVHVHEFSIGMGPVLVSKKRGDTLYALRLIPIGGYVRMAGEDRLETGETIPAERVLYKKPPYLRALISLCGPAMNLLLALVVTLATAWAMSLPVLQVADVVPGAPAAAVLQPGDRIVNIGNETIYTLDDITRAIAASGGNPIAIVIRRGGNEQTLTIQPRASEGKAGYEIGAYFLSFAPTNEIASVLPTSTLYVAGIEAGDQILSVGGEAVSTGLGVLSALDKALQGSDVVALQVLRDGALVNISLRANGRTTDDILKNVEFGNHGVESRRPGFAAGLTLGLRDFATYASLLGRTLRDLVSGSREAREAISGPVGIADMVRQGWALGFLVFLKILGFLSLNFAIINMIPFPGLDGSRVVFAVVEWIRGRPIPPQREGVIHAIGFVVMLVLLVLVTYRDILRLLG